jgi:tripartite-type tricarboxylate transporter receptor subunit TctC
VPTFAELGHKDVELSAWYGLLGPANMPAAITERLNKEVGAVLADPDFKRQLADMMFEAQGSTPKELETIITQDLIRFTKVTREAGMQSE